MRGGVLQLQKWGLLDRIVAAGTPPVRRTVFHYGDERVAVSIKPASGVDALYAPRRTMLDALLVGEAERAGASVEFGMPVVELCRRADGQVSGVLLHDRRTGRVHAEHATLVIGADGRESLIAREVGAANVFTGQHSGAYLYGYWPGEQSTDYEWFYRPGLAAGVIPTNQGARCVFVGGSPDRLSAELIRRSPAQAWDRLAPRFGLGHRAPSAGRLGPIRVVRSLPAGYLRVARGPGWALVGDAGHWMDPISTHGMTSALRDAELLADSILSGSVSSQPSSYQLIRDRISLPMLQTSDEIASFSWDLTRIRVLLRRMSSAMTDEVEALALLGPAA
jgi:2-polyprenyl-6-methoxyphenol hydroxylase-like FAD-dependent oxidoreductase